MYDIVIAGSGLYGAVFAYEANKRGLKTLVVERRDHTGGNVYCKKVNGIQVHVYGAHIFHTKNESTWQYIKKFADFNNYRNSPLANFEGHLFSLPFNMNTFYQLWHVLTPGEAEKEINRQREKYKQINPKNLEEMALQKLGDDIYYKLIKGYTEKQWGKPATELPAFIINRIPLRFTFDNNYFNDPFQGIPIGGYNPIIEKLLNGSKVLLNTDFLENKEYFHKNSGKIVYTGEPDRYFNYCFGKLEYRSLRFDHQTLEHVSNYQGNAVINYTSKKVPFTRVIEHKHFEFGDQPDTVITKEYPTDYSNHREPFYPVNDERNNQIYNKYKQLAEKEARLHLGGRLGKYRYYNMDQVIESALNDIDKLLPNHAPFHG